MEVTIYRDYKEEGWESMEVYANNLINNLKNKNLIIKQFVACQKLSKRFTKDRKLSRYFFRYFINPPLATLAQGRINHIIDQANVHLLSFVDPVKTVVTCHDLIVPFWLTENRPPNNFKKKVKKLVENWRIKQLKKAAKIIAVSQATKKDIINRLKINPGKIVVIPEGTEEYFRPIKDKKLLNKFKKENSLPDKYLLYVGSCEAYKNIKGLLEVFACLAKKNKNLYLVKVGQPWHQAHKNLIRKLDLKKRIKYLGYLPRHQLPLVYNLALGLVQLSFIEGFGLTVLEALSCGCPVIVSSTPALKELVGKAGLVVNIRNKSEIIRNIQKIIDSEKIRQNLIYKGLVRSKQFTWEKTAKLTYQVYQNLFAGNQ